MIHINKSLKTGQFIVVTTGKNHEKLNSSELLKSKQSAYKNIRADLVEKESESALVQDNTLKHPEVVRVYADQKNRYPTAMAAVKAPEVE